MVKVYVAGKLNDMACDYIQNLHYMMRCASNLREMGFSVYVPGNDFLEGLVSGLFTYQDYFQNNIEWILASDCVYVCPRKADESKGVSVEVKLAQDFHIPVFYDLKSLRAFQKEVDDIQELSYLFNKYKSD